MKPALKPEGLIELAALLGNLGPLPVAEAMFGMVTSRVLMAGAHLGLFASLADGSRTAGEAAAENGLDAEGTRLLLDSLCVTRHVIRSAGRYRLAARARKWLDPASPTYVGAFLEFNYDQWDWWSRLEEVVRRGRGADIHEYGPEDPRWERYITAMFQLARISAPELAGRVRLPRGARRLLDVAGAHGWFAAEICRRNPGLEAVVLDLPPSARAGRKLLANTDMADRVAHREGDALVDPLGGPYDAVICFQLVHHLSAEDNRHLFRRIRAALNPGGVFAVMDYFAPPPGHRPGAADFLGLHFFVTSSAATYRREEVEDWLQEAGFGTPLASVIRRIPSQVLLQATAGKRSEYRE